MNGSAGQNGSAGLDARSGRANLPPSPGVSIGASGNVGINGSYIAGGNLYKNSTTIDKRRNLRIGIGFGSVALVAVVAIAIHAAASGSTSVVYQAGEQGAVGTIQQLQQAEEKGESSTWCFLASSDDPGTCQALLANGYSTSESATIRSQIPQISISDPAGGNSSYTFSLIYQGRTYPGVTLDWTGQRWELSPDLYYGALNDSGVFCAVIETAHHLGALVGVPFG